MLPNGMSTADGLAEDEVKWWQRRALARDLVRSVELWPVWVRLGLQDVRLRFHRSTIGVGWILLQPLAMIASAGFVYSKLLGQDVVTFLPFLAVGIIAWSYLTASIVEGGNAFIASQGYIKQIGLPIYVYVLRFFVAASVTGLVSLLACVAVGVWFAIPVGWGTLWVVPGMLLFGVVSILLVAIFAHLNARFRDAAHIAAVGLQLVFFVTPVLWPPDLLRTRGVGWVVDVNPFYHLVEVVRRPVLSAQSASADSYLAVGILVIALIAIASALIWHYQRRIVYFL